MILVLGYWSGDEANAFRLAKFLADLEPAPRGERFVFVRQHGTPATPELGETVAYVGRKFLVEAVESTNPRLPGKWGGCDAIWPFEVDYLSKKYPGDFAFIFEHDGAPVCKDWLNKLAAEHAITRGLGRQVTGALTWVGTPVHLNGNVVIDTNFWPAHPEIHDAPPDSPWPWDVRHRAVFTACGRASGSMINDWGRRQIAEEYVRDISAAGVVWVHGCKDDSLYARARQMLLGDLDETTLGRLLTVPPLRPFHTPLKIPRGVFGGRL